MYSLLLSGGSNVIIPAFTPEAVMAAVQNERVTDVLLVPTMIQMLVDHSALGSYDLSSLKKIIYGASPISEAVMSRATAALPNVQFTQAYGMTELSPMATRAALEGTHRRRPRQGPPPGRRPRHAGLRGSDRRSRQQAGALRHGRRDHRPWRQCHDGLLGAARRNRPRRDRRLDAYRRQRLHGCKTDSSMSSIGSRT